MNIHLQSFLNPVRIKSLGEKPPSGDSFSHAGEFSIEKPCNEYVKGDVYVVESIWNNINQKSA
jgi:hypothetical protein